MLAYAGRDIELIECDTRCIYQHELGGIRAVKGKCREHRGKHQASSTHLRHHRSPPQCSPFRARSVGHRRGSCVTALAKTRAASTGAARLDRSQAEPCDLLPGSSSFKPVDAWGHLISPCAAPMVRRTEL